MEYKLKISEGNVYKKWAELEESFHEKSKKTMQHEMRLMFQIPENAPATPRRALPYDLGRALGTHQYRCHRTTPHLVQVQLLHSHRHWPFHQVGGTFPNEKSGGTHCGQTTGRQNILCTRLPNPDSHWSWPKFREPTFQRALSTLVHRQSMHHSLPPTF